MPPSSHTVLSDVVLAKCIESDLDTPLDRLRPLELEVFMRHLYSTAARRIMARTARVSVDQLLALWQRLPPLSFLKMAFGRGLMGPSETMREKGTPVRWILVMVALVT